jgi:hypothetical protein
VNSCPNKAELIAKDWAEGSTQIGCVIDRDERAALHLCYTRQLPAFKLGGKWCMRPSTYFRHIEKLEDTALAQCAALPPAELPADP